MIDSVLFAVPDTALNELNKMTLEMFDRVSWNVRQASELLLVYDSAESSEVLLHEKEIDLWERELGEDIIRLDPRRLTPSGQRLKMQLHLSIGSFEQLGNDAVKLQQIASRMNESGLEFSNQEKQLLYTVKTALTELLKLTGEAFRTNQMLTIRKVYALRDALTQMISHCRVTALKHIQTGRCGDSTFSSFSCVLSDIQSMGDRCCAICTSILDLTEAKKKRGLLTPAFVKASHPDLVAAYLDKYSF